MRIRPFISLLRPTQWIKNGFIFLPMFFGGYMREAAVWREAIICFIAYSLMASGIYCLNDIRDAEADRQHPRKRLRPVASGEISVKSATAACILLAVSALTITLTCITINPLVTTAILAAYLVMNVAYSLRLKQLALIDVTIVALGFVLRVLAGGKCEGIPLSPWIILMTFLLALFLAFAKRRDDVLINERSGSAGRLSTRGYNLQFMNVTLGVLASTTIVCYIMYTVSPEVTERMGSGEVYLSSIFVLVGILRYLQLTIVAEVSGSPTEVLLKDRTIQGCLAGWILFFLTLIYIGSLRN